MRPITLNTRDASGGAKTSGLAVLDTYQDPFNVGFGAVELFFCHVRACGWEGG